MSGLIEDKKRFLLGELKEKRDILLEIFGTQEESIKKNAVSIDEKSARGLLLADISDEAGNGNECRYVKIISYTTGDELHFEKDDPLKFINQWFPKAQKQTEKTIIPEGTKYVLLKFRLEENDRKKGESDNSGERTENDKDYILLLNNGKNSFILLNKEKLAELEEIWRLKRENKVSGIQETYEKLNKIREEIKGFNKEEFNAFLDDIDAKLEARKQTAGGLFLDIDNKMSERKQAADSFSLDIDNKLSEIKQTADNITLDIDSRLKEIKQTIDDLIEKHENELKNQDTAFRAGFDSKIEEFRNEKDALFSELDRKMGEIKKLAKKLSEQGEICEPEKESPPLGKTQDKGAYGSHSDQSGAQNPSGKEGIKKAELIQACETLEKDINKLQAAVSCERPLFSELITRVKEYVLSKGFVYSEDQEIIERFLSSLYTGQIIILSGPPGTGKTSLPRLVAEAVGAKLHFISVQSDWTDAQDLLGFFDYAHERYAATPFLDALRDAANDSHRMHFVMLDEMNLSHIEYYFSAVLSALEADRKLRLFGNSVKDTSDNPWPPEFIIPENVQFIGTLNMDDTTRRPSPKVLDRSYVIEINEAEDEGAEDLKENSVSPALTGESRSLTYSFILAADYFDPERRDYMECFDTDIKAAENEIKVLKAIASFEKLNDSERLVLNESKLSLSLSKRAIKQAERMLRQGADLDSVVCGKLLVTLKNGNPIEDEKELAKVLKNCLNKNYSADWSISEQKIEKMIQDNEIDYWR